MSVDKIPPQSTLHIIESTNGSGEIVKVKEHEETDQIVLPKKMI